MVHLQDSISECLHHHTLSSMLSDGMFEANPVQILSCLALEWAFGLLFSPIFSTFF
jgi:hypothetical protein